ncbi:hypothetical protein H1Q59_00455 [Holosporaceae bacterium 'Namur']|nr:hypothetical protein [Holosporaceae bacterium 'Namur']
MNKKFVSLFSVFAVMVVLAAKEGSRRDPDYLVSPLKFIEQSMDAIALGQKTVSLYGGF